MKPLLILKTYAWLVNTIRNHGPISYKDILELWNNDRLSEGNNMVRQTFIHYKNDLEEFFNISIGCDRQYRYYIKNGAVNTRCLTLREVNDTVNWKVACQSRS